MFDSRKRWDSSVWEVFFMLHVMALLLGGLLCFDPCPESLRRSSAARAPNIPDSEVEKAFLEAQYIVHHKRMREKRLAREGRVVNKHVKSTDSTHPQANAPPRVREMELRQLLFEEVTNLLAVRYKLTQDQVACGLSKLELTEASALRAQEQCLTDEEIVCDRSAKYRTADGTCNNLDNPTWGSAFSGFRRLLPAQYSANGGMRMSVKCSPLPSPRTLSLNVHSNVNRRTNNVNHMYMFFGQFLDHDITATAQSITENYEAIQCCPPRHDNHHQCAPIIIPAGDPFYAMYNITCLNFVRSALFPSCSLGARIQMNMVTPFIDASHVYGNSANETNSLRRLDGTGELLVQHSEVGDLLPASFEPASDRCSVLRENLTCFATGDARANQHPTLTSLHTLCVREHNRIARILRKLNPNWDEETLFQEARKIVGALVQSITFREYLPITVGTNLMYYFGLWPYWDSNYDKDMDATLWTEFSTGAFRFGHSMIHSVMSEEPRKPGHMGHLLRDVYFWPFNLYSGEMDPLLRGATKSPAQYFDRYMVPDVTNYLYRIRGHSAGSDLASVNIQRGRDHGIPGYAAYATICDPYQNPIKSFDDLVENHLMTPEMMEIMRSNYESVEDIDLFTGIICEIHLSGAILGQTGACIVARQFQRLKDGDRFFFQHGGAYAPFTDEQRSSIRYSASLAKLMCDNTNISEVPHNALLLPSNTNPIVPCNSISGIDLHLWEERYRGKKK